MGKIIVLFLVSVMLFAGGLGGALYFRGLQKPAEDGETTAKGDSKAVAKGAKTAKGEAAKMSAELPVAFHGKPMSTDDVFRFTASIRGRERELKRREDALEQQEARLKMMVDDLKQQRLEVDGKMQEVQLAIEQTERAVQELLRQRQELSKEQTAAKRTLEQARSQQLAIDKQGAARVKELANIFSGSDENQSASRIRTLIDQGDLQFVVQVLAEVEPRTAAKVLDALDDPTLASQIMKAYHRLPKPQR